MLRRLPIYHYNLACFEAQLGNIAHAKEYLAAAFRRNEKFKQTALEDPDLISLW